MSLFEALYGRKCNTPVSWDNSIDRVVIGPNLLKEMEEHIVRIRHNLKAAQYKQKSYVDKNTVFKDFKVGEHVFLRKARGKHNVVHKSPYRVFHTCTWV
jgi:hypothetical protein